MLQIQHNQLNTSYPKCPFVWNFNDFKNTFEHEVTDLDIDILYSMLDQDTRSFITQLIESNTDSVTTCYSCTQRCHRDLIRKKDIWINFVTASYGDDVGHDINSLYEKYISWCIVPLIGNVEFKSNKIGIINRKLDDTTKDVVSKEIKVITSRQNTTLDNKNEIDANNIRNTRLSTRRIVVSDIKVIKPKCDTYEDLDPNDQSECKFKRMLSKDQPKHNRIISTPINNNRYMFDFFTERVAVTKASGIYRFAPTTTGRVALIPDKLKNNTNTELPSIIFVSLLRNGDNLHITLHKIIVY